MVTQNGFQKSSKSLKMVIKTSFVTATSHNPACSKAFFRLARLQIGKRIPSSRFLEVETIVAAAYIQPT